MKSLFEAESKDEILNRINKLNDTSSAQWGTMNVAQMLKHCQGPIEVAMGKKELDTNIGFMKKMVFKLFKSSLYNDKLWKPGIPTAPEYVVKNDHDFNTEKANLETTINEFSALENKTDWTDHVFFGKLTAEQWGKSQYKHLDHHLRQFGV
jgi:hypothetical protein